MINPLPLLSGSTTPEKIQRPGVERIAGVQPRHISTEQQLQGKDRERPDRDREPERHGPAVAFLRGVCDPVQGAIGREAAERVRFVFPKVLLL